MTMQPDELKALRLAAGLSQAGLGEAIGMSRETIGAMERGTAPIELRTALAVRYITESRKPDTMPDVAAGILGQGPGATRSDAELLRFLDQYYVRREMPTPSSILLEKINGPRD